MQVKFLVKSQFCKSKTKQNNFTFTTNTKLVNQQRINLHILIYLKKLLMEMSYIILDEPFPIKPKLLIEHSLNPTLLMLRIGK